jgi:SAM-dependent methyltransferase
MRLKSSADHMRIAPSGRPNSRLPDARPGPRIGWVTTFDELIAEGAAVPTDGWDFSWFEGRATEERPPWGYARLLGQRMAALAEVPGAAALDLQTGGGEVLASVPAAPRVLLATESWPPNLEIARRNLAPLGGQVIAQDDELDDLPFGDASFDLVVSRHPVGVRFDEIARVLRPGGTYFSQDVGAGSVAELSEFMLGPLPPDDGPTRDPKWSVLAAQEAGLEVTELREFRGRMEFGDIAAVVYFLRKVIWIVPGFTVGGYLGRLRALHDQIQADGPFPATSVRFLIEARKPGRANRAGQAGPAAAGR